MQPKQEPDFTQPSETSYIPSVPPTTEQLSAAPVEAAAPAPPAAQVSAQNEFSPEDDAQATDDINDDGSQPLRWQASEYIHHDRSPLWYVALLAVVVVLGALSLFLIKSWTFTLLIPVMAVALVVYVRRPPMVIDYTLSDKGLFINDTLHGFSEFKSFGVVHDGNEYSVSLIPVRRFRPSLSVYFPEEAGEAIVDMLGVRLPMEQLKPDVFDKIVRMLRI